MLFVFLCSSIITAGTTGKIAGKVIDVATGDALPGTNIIVVGTNLGAASDDEGDFYVLNIQPGVYSVKATMMGYTIQIQTDVLVNIDRTTPVDFSLETTTIEGEVVTIIAGRDVIHRDISSSQVISDVTDIVQVPMVTNIEDFISLQGGIEGDMIRGGSIDQTGFMLDGLMMVDNRSNTPMMSVNLSSVQEVSIIKGGFNAEYDNVRSGLVNVVTKEGDVEKYSGSIDFQRIPANLKHSGASLYNPSNYYLRPYLDPEVCFEGTAVGGWSQEMQDQYPSFLGWDNFSAVMAGQGINITPTEARELFMYQHQVEGADAVGGKVGKYGDQPDFNFDAGFGGPVPLIGEYLGDLTFFTSYRLNKEMFGLPTSRDYFSEDNFLMKLTSRITPSMKLTLEGTYGETHTVASVVDNFQNLEGDFRAGSDYGRVNYVPGGSDIFDTNLGLNPENIYSHRGAANLYWPSSLSPFDIYRSMQGISFDHVLSPSTFYNVRISHIRVKNVCSGPDAWRNPATVKSFGDIAVDEQPFGFWWEGGPQIMAGDGMLIAAIGAGARDYSEVNTLNIKFDLTSQVNKYNQIKTGFVFNYDDMNTHMEKVSQYAPGDSWVNKWRQFPYRIGAYAQDKLEFEGLIANIGMRLDYMQPNTDWYDVDRYSEELSKQNKDQLTTDAASSEAKSHLKISPRLGISHPIGDKAKLYFNYGHFYSMAPAFDLYQIDYGLAADGITFLGNPSADLPKTVSYELGFEYDIADMYLVHVSGYYKDVTDETGQIAYENISGSVSYTTIENNQFADIRGFEIRLEKRYGTWFTGWLNYNYMVAVDGRLGRETYYQDRARQVREGLYNPYFETPLAQPYARANLSLHSPKKFGPSVLGQNVFGNINVTSILTWKKGDYESVADLKTQTISTEDDIAQWRDEYNVDLRISKTVDLGTMSGLLYLDVHNLFNSKFLRDNGFASDADRRDYLRSLHLPEYAGDEYQSAGLTAGNDKIGDVDKDYINMPNRAFLTYLDPRVIVMGLKFNF